MPIALAWGVGDILLSGGTLRLRHSLGPVRLQQRRVVDNGWEQGREGPEQERGEELADNRVLEDKVHSRESQRGSGPQGLRPGLRARWLSGLLGQSPDHPPVPMLC